MKKLLSIILVSLLQITGSYAYAYHLTVEVTPNGSGQTNSSGGVYDAGEDIYLYTYNNSGYVFQGWYDGDELISSETSINYTMPERNAYLYARYEFDPETPPNPNVQPTKYTVNVQCKPSNSGSFNRSSFTEEEGYSVDIYAYPNTWYRFIRWEDESGNILGEGQSLEYVIPHGNTTIYGIFEFDPDVPGNPDKNYTELEREAERAATNDRQTLQSMKDDLEQAANDYSDYLDQVKYNALLKSIADWNKKISEAYELVFSSHTEYTTPWTSDEIAALQNEVADFIQGMKDAYQADANKQLIEEITQAANADREALAAVRSQWESVATQMATDYPGIVSSFTIDKDYIDYLLNELSEAIEAAQREAVESLSNYQSPSVTEYLEEVSAIIEQYQNDVQSAAANALEEAEAAANADREILQSLKSELEQAAQEYSAYVDQGKYNSLLSRISYLEEQITEAYNNTLTAGQYNTPLTYEVMNVLESEIEDFIQGLKDAKEADVNSQIVAEITRAANADRESLAAVRTQWEGVVAQMASDYPGFVSAYASDKDYIDDRLNELSDAIEYAFNEAINTLEPYESPSVSQALDEIKSLISAYEQNVKADAEKAQKDAEAAANADRQVLQKMKSELEQVAQDYSAYVDKSKYNTLMGKIEEWDGKVTEAYNTAVSTGKYTTPWSKDAIEALQSDVAGFIQGLKDAQQAAESAKIIEAIHAAANADRQAMNSVRTEWERVAAQVAKDYPAAYVAAFNDAKLAIDNKLTELSAAIDAAESTAVNSLKAYETPAVTQTLEEINGLISTYQQNVKAAYDKAKADADAAVTPDRLKLQTLKDKVEKANLDYSAYVNKTEYNALIKSIDDWNKEVTKAYNNAVNNGTAYTTPWTATEIAALEKSVDDFVQRLIDAKESDTDQQRVEEITKAANADREKVQSLHTEWEQVLAQLNEKYPGFTLAFDKANIDTKFSKVSSDIDAAQRKAIEELSTYVSPSVDSALSEIQGLIEKYQQDVEAAVQKIKEDALAAANADRTTVSNAKQVAENAINATDSKYPAFVIEADRNAIYSRYEKLMSDIENAYNKAVETLSTYVSPSVAQALVEIDALVTKYQRDVAAAAEAAKTEATKLADADKATLTALSEQVEQINDKYGPLGCVDTQKVNAINSAIQALRGKIDSALSDVYTVGSYKSPLTASDLQKIREDISALEADCKTRLDAAIDKAAQADRDKVSSLKTQYDNLIESLEKEYDSYRDLEQEKAIAQLFETITERINQAVAKAKADGALYVSPDVDNYLKNTITTKMNAYYDEVIEKASGSMSEAEKAAQRDKKILTDLKKDLDDARVEYAQYLQYVDENSYVTLCDIIEDWKTKVDQAKETAKETGEYSSPWTQNQLNNLQNDVNTYITALRSEKELDIRIASAAQADRKTLEDKKKVLDEAISETNRTYPAFANSEAKTVIEQMFSTLSSDIDQAEQDALQERSDYSSPSVSNKLADIESRVNQYTGDVSAAADKAMAEANTQAGVDRELLSTLKSQVETTYNTYNELNCVDETIKETKNSIDTSIKALNDSIQPALNAVYTKGYYRTPWTDATIDGIRYTIGLFKGACEEKYKTLVKGYADSDRATVAAKQDEYLSLNADVHKVEGLVWKAEHEAMEKNIAKMFTDILEVINKVANEATTNAEPYNNEEVQSYLQAIDDEIKAYKQSLINQITVNEAITLNESEKTLQDIYEFYHELYEELLEENGYYRLEEEINRLIDMLNQAGETALNPTVGYDGSDVAEEIKIVTEDINSLEYTIRSHHFDAVMNAANEDLVKLSETQAKFNALIQSLDMMSVTRASNGTRDLEMEQKVGSMLSDLSNKIDQEVKDAINNHHAYNSFAHTLDEINIWMDAYEKLVKGLNDEGLTDDEIDSLVAIESETLKELENRLEDIYRIYEDYVDMDEYEDLLDTLNNLKERLEEARAQGYDSHQYSTPWEEDEINDLRERIDEFETETRDKADQNGIAKIEADPDTDVTYYDLNGRLIKNPAPGKLYIRIAGGKAMKVIL